jgi:DNA polymerase IIIc chi subunit
MTNDDYEQKAVVLANLARELAGWHPDALAYVLDMIEETETNLRTMREKVNTARAA